MFPHMVQNITLSVPNYSSFDFVLLQVWSLVLFNKLCKTSYFLLWVSLLIKDFKIT
jgi:hypothetical protein